MCGAVRDVDQLLLMPPSVPEWLPEDHLAFSFSMWWPTSVCRRRYSIAPGVVKRPGLNRLQWTARGRRLLTGHVDLTLGRPRTPDASTQ
jgi:hypothetical protein